MGSHMRVALFEDDIGIIRMVERVLKAEGIAVDPITTFDLDEAVGIIAGGGYHAVLVDVYLYDSALGFRFIERLRRDPRVGRIPLIVTSAARHEIRKHAEFLREHACDVVFKPFQPDDLVRTLRASTAIA